MEIMDQLLAIATKVEQTREQIQTEEATKTTLILPFINSVLGYNVFDINEVVPEFIADVGLKKGEKIDFAILRDGEVSMLIECKKVSQPLSLNNADQLFRYFHVTNARIAILTNGQIWQFYTDLDTPNKMDSKPFMELDLLAIDPTIVPQIAKHSKANFDLDSVLNAAEELKYLSAIKRVLASQMAEIEPEFAQFFLNRVYPGRITPKIKEQLTPVVQRAIKQFVTDQVNERLKKALGGSAAEAQSALPVATEAEPAPTESDATPEADEPDSGIETTVEEIQGHMIVRALVGDLIDLNRICMRDAKSYCAIICDDNNRKPVVRLWFNTSQWHLGTFDADKKETRIPISGLADLYKYRDEIRETVTRYL